MFIKSFCLATLALTAALSAIGVELARGGQPVGVIEIVPEATAADRHAAAELQRYLQRITGATLPIVTAATAAEQRILLGAAAGIADWNNPEEVRIESRGPAALAVAGEGTRGTLFAVYTLLEELGVRFYSADDEVIPTIDPLVLNHIAYRYAPPFRYREAHSEIANGNAELSAKWRLNGAMYRTAPTAELGGFYQMDMTHSLINEFLKPADYFEAHPEWYAWRQDSSSRQPTQLCLSDPQAVAELLKQVRAKLEARPDLRFLAIGGADNNAYCQCELCSAAAAAHGTPAAAYLQALNTVARAIAADYPEVQIMFQAYWATERPPDNMVLEPNVAVTLAVLDRNHGLPVSATPRHNQYLDGWRRLTGGKIYIWDYWATFGNFLLPMPNLDLLDDAMRTYCEYGVQGVFNQLPFGSLAEFGDLRNYLFAQLAWNPYRDAERLTAEFCHAHYGAAAPAILSYIALLEKARDRQPGVWIGVYSEETKHWLTPQDLQQARALFDTALQATAATPVPQTRVRQLRASLLLVEILRYDELTAAGVPLPERDRLIAELEALGQEFHCGAYKEWDDFSNLIQRLRTTPAAAPAAAVVAPPSGQSARQVLPSELSGPGAVVTQCADGTPVIRLDSHQRERGYPLLPFSAEAIQFTVPPELAGVWEVSITLRVIGETLEQIEGANVGIYAPHETIRLPIPSGPGTTDWQTIALGRQTLPPGSFIWAMPGVVAPITAIEVKAIQLQPAL